MPCYTRVREKKVQKKREKKYKKLKEDLKSGKAKIVKDGDSIKIEGWEDREDWCDECVIRRMRQSSDFQVRQLVNNAVPKMEGIAFGHQH
jgi:hypothetical protein